MSLAPTRSVSSATTTHITRGVTDPDAIAAFLRPGVPLDDAFWRRLHHRCDHCLKAGTTVCGALWRVSLQAECQALYYLHSACLPAYKRAHGLRSVEGRVPLVAPAPADLGPTGMWRTWSVADPAVGAITTLYDPHRRAIAYAVGRDDPTLVRVAARLNGDGAATAEAVR